MLENDVFVDVTSIDQIAFLPFPFHPPAMSSEKGYARRADVPPRVKQALQAGTRETKTLSEFLVIDLGKLLIKIVPDLRSSAKLLSGKQLSLTKRMVYAGKLLAEHAGPDCLAWREHQSDTVRGWAAFAIVAQAQWNLKRCLKELLPLANDPHFGVREWAWMALRPRVASNLEDSLERLADWTGHQSANVRRFASEVTRPRGVWCEHLQALKAEPHLATGLLEPLRSDESKYVRDSVGNWLNDAAKSQPAWVKQLCHRWEQESPTKETKYIVKKALRNL
jgi:3-methyladenine DNA glycosylase AlkC